MPRRFCSYTFVEETDEIRLFRCQRCMDTYYKDKEAQKAHWRIHKQACTPLNEADRERYMSMNATDVAFNLAMFTSLSSQIQVAGFSRAFLYLLQRLEVLCQEPVPLADDRFEDPEALINGSQDIRVKDDVMFSKIHAQTPDSFIELMWAAPGVTNYLLGHDLMSDAMKEKKAQGVLPTWDELNCGTYNPAIHLHPVFSRYIGYLVAVSAFAPNRPGHPADEFNFVPRHTALARAAAGRALSWWADPYTRASIPQRVFSTASPRKMWFFTLFCSCLMAPRWAPSVKENEIFPGLTVKDTFMILAMEECIAFCPNVTLYPKICASLTRTLWLPWNEHHFTVSDRAEVARALVQQYLLSSDIEEGREKFAKNLLWMVMFCPGREASLWLRVARKAIRLSTQQDGELDNAGIFFKESLNMVLESYKPSVDEFIKLVRDQDGGLVDDVPDEVVEIVCEFCIALGGYGNMENDIQSTLAATPTPSSAPTRTWSHLNT